VRWLIARTSAAYAETETNHAGLCVGRHTAEGRGPPTGRPTCCPMSPPSSCAASAKAADTTHRYPRSRPTRATFARAAPAGPVAAAVARRVQTQPRRPGGGVTFTRMHPHPRTGLGVPRPTQASFYPGFRHDRQPESAPGGAAVFTDPVQPISGWSSLSAPRRPLPEPARPRDNRLRTGGRGGVVSPSARGQARRCARW